MLTAGIAGADLASTAALAGLLAVPPLLAGTVLDWRRTALIGTASTGLCVVLVTGAGGTVGETRNTTRLTVVGAAAAFATWSAWWRSQREARLRHVRRVAEAAQHAILPPIPNQLGPLRVATRYLSATREAHVGGDLFEAAALSTGIRVVVGDTRGKGIDAVRLAAVTMGAFREAAHVPENALGVVVEAADRSVGRHGGDEDFVTAVFIEVVDACLRVANCGHHPPLLVMPRTHAHLDEAPPAPPLGLGAVPTTTEHLLSPGDRVLLYTDCLVEARDRSGRFFPLDDAVDLLRHEDLEIALDALIDRLRAFSRSKLHDDLAVVLFEFCPPVVHGDDRRRDPVSMTRATACTADTRRSRGP